jgi:hypothetical protein
MSREFIIGERYAGPDLNNLYAADFRHIASNCIQTPLNMWYGKKGHYTQEQRDVLAYTIKKFRREARKLLSDAEQDKASLDPEMAGMFSDFYKQANRPGVWVTEKCLDLQAKMNEIDAYLQEKSVKHPEENPENEIQHQP